MNQLKKYEYESRFNIDILKILRVKKIMFSIKYKSLGHYFEFNSDIKQLKKNIKSKFCN